MSDRQRERGSQLMMGLLIVAALVALIVLISLWVMPSMPQPDQSSESVLRQSQSEQGSASSTQSLTESDSASSSEFNASDETNPGHQAHMQAIRDAYAGIFNPQQEGQIAVYFQDLSVNQEALVLKPQAMRSASIIKLFIMQVLLEEVRAGRLNLEEVYTLQASDQVGGTGDLQAAAPGTEWTLADLAQEMLIRSDNTATNILIERLGGVATVNQAIRKLGYQETRLERLMMDQEAIAAGIDNWTSVSEVGQLLARLYQHQLVGPEQDTLFLTYLAQQTDRRGLVAALDADTITTYSKSGQNPTQGLQHDASIVEWGPGKAYVLVVLQEGGQAEQQLADLQTFGARVWTIVSGE